jgi:hypothetical protein
MTAFSDPAIMTRDNFRAFLLTEYPEEKLSSVARLISSFGERDSRTLRSASGKLYFVVHVTARSVVSHAAIQFGVTTVAP